MRKKLRLTYRGILKWSLIICALIGLNPPWGYIHPETGQFIESYGYSLLFEPPNERAHIDTSKLFISWFVVVLVAGALMLSIKNPDANNTEIEKD